MGDENDGWFWPAVVLFMFVILIVCAVMDNHKSDHIRKLDTHIRRLECQLHKGLSAEICQDLIR